MNTLKKYSHWLYLFIFLSIGGYFFYYLYQNFEQQEIAARNLKLENQHRRSIEQFTSSVDKFAGLVSGMRSYINLSPQLPSAANFQQFISNQYNDLELRDSIVVSFIDTTHIFQQSFSRNAMDPSKLVGQSVYTIRNEEEIRRLNHLMTHDSLQMFPPINLVEGWVGLPIVFRVHRNNKTVGYVAPIQNFKSIIEEIYKDDLNAEFVFQFRTKQGSDFDREQVYDNTRVYNKDRDPEYYKNFDVDASKFLVSTLSNYGYEVKIGTAFKNSYESNTNFIRILLIWYLTIVLLASIVAWQINRFRKLNLKLVKNNKLLLRNRKEINYKNQELLKLTKTQKKFFSIIGHDIKQPLSAIEGLLVLLQDQDINDTDLEGIVKGLTSSTKNTTNLLNNLLRWAHSQTGDLKYVPVQVDMNVVIEDVIETLESQAKEKYIKLVFKRQEVIRYRGDVDMLHTIFRNLISNAIKFSHPVGTVEVISEIRENSIAIQVKDTGIGMTTKEIESLFKLDQQISTVGTSGEMGTGLGLILCHDFTKKHGGFIEVESELDKGTQFTVVLPT